MKQRSNSIKELSLKKNLWRQINTKPQQMSPVLKRKSGTITDFLKTVHVAHTDWQRSNSEVVSVMDIQYSDAMSKKSTKKERRYFITLLFKAIFQIWKQINGSCQEMKKQMNIAFNILSNKVKQTGQLYQKQIQQKDNKISELKNTIQGLQKQNRYYKDLLDNKQKQTGSQLMETNKQLRNYLRNMNQIMMSYHQKNNQLEESLKNMEKKYNNAVREETKQIYSMYQELADRFYSQSMQRTSITDDTIQQAFKYDQRKTFNESTSILLSRSKPTSPSSQSSKKFFRKSQNSTEGIKYIPPAIFHKENNSHNSQSIQMQPNSFNRKSLENEIQAKKKILKERKKFMSPPILRQSFDILQK